MDISSGFITGILAMFSWGVADFLSAQSGRKLGALIGSFWFHVGSLLILLPFTPQLRGVNLFMGKDLFPLASLSILFIFSYLLFLRALDKGLVSIIIPVFGTYSVIPAIAGIVLFGETLNAPQVLAITVMLVGLMLVSSDWREIQKEDRRAIAKGLPEAIAAMLLTGILNTLLTSQAREQGWLIPMLWMRLGGLLLITPFVFKGLRNHFRREVIKFAIPAGLFDAIAYSSFSIGVTLAPVTIVSPISGTSPIVSMALAFFLLGERIAPNQRAGVIAILSGLTILGINS